MSPQEIATAVQLRRNNARVADIAKQMGRSRQSIYNAVKRYDEEGRTEPNSKPGGPKRLSNRDFRALARYVKQDRTVTLDELVDYLPTKVSSRTLRNYMKDEEFQGRIAAERPPLTSAQKKRRHAKKHGN